VENNIEADRVTVFVDHREENSNVSRHIKELGAEVLVNQLEIGDYITSDRTGIERKRVSDFLSSIVDQRLFRQVEELSSNFDAPLLILEGNPELLFMSRKIHPNAVRGALASISLDYRVPILYSGNPKETAAQIYWIAYREQVREKRPLQIRAARKCLDENSLQEYIISGLPNINSKLSKRLLSHFGSVKAVFSATQEKFMEVEGIGEKKAKRVWEIINRRYGRC